MGTDHAATVFHRSHDNTLNKCAEAEGMGSGIPIKIAGMQKSPNGVSVIHGESCPNCARGFAEYKIPF